jgi:hypothetical protein
LTHGISFLGFAFCLLIKKNVPPVRMKPTTRKINTQRPAGILARLSIAEGLVREGGGGGASEGATEGIGTRPVLKVVIVGMMDSIVVIVVMLDSTVTE